MNDLVNREDVIKLIESKLTDGHLQINEYIPLFDASELLDDISDLPTVYDVDKIVEELVNMYIPIVEEGKDTNYELVRKREVIEIVKRGGVE